MNHVRSVEQRGALPGVFPWKGDFMRKSSGKFVLVVVIASLGMTVAASPPDVFSDMKFKDAKAKAIETKKLFIVDATASWCAPCKMMDQTTWIDEDVVSWINEHAIAIQLDVDEEKMGAKMLKISAMPTIIAFKEGKEFDRVVGYQDAPQLLEWLDGVGEGRRAIDKLRERAGDRMDPEGNVDIDARYDLARTLMLNGELDEATEEYVWLWENMLKFDPAYSGVRLSFMAGDMAELVNKHEPAKKAFMNLRDQLTDRVEKGNADRNVLVDWLHLNEIIADDEATLDWYDRIKDAPIRSEALRSVENDIFKLLIERKRWSDAGWVYENPEAQARIQILFSGMNDLPNLPEDQIEMFRKHLEKSLLSDLSLLYAACLAAEREKSAGEVAALLLKEMDDEISRFGLIKAALGAGQPRMMHSRWLDEAAEQGEKNTPLRRKLEQALAEKEEK